jgi:nitrate reductase NapD
MSAEIHIVSCVVHARPDRMAAVDTYICEHNLAEIHGRDPRGRLVILIEREYPGDVLAAIDEIKNQQGVIAVNLVYQHAEDARALQEPCHELDAT